MKTTNIFTIVTMKLCDFLLGKVLKAVGVVFSTNNMNQSSQMKYLILFQKN